MQDLFCNKRFFLFRSTFRRYFLFVLFFVIFAFSQAYAFERTFLESRGYYFGPSSLKKNPTLYFKKNAVQVYSEIIADGSPLFNNYNFAVAVDLNLLKLGVGANFSLYDIYNRSEWFISDSLTLPFGFYIGTTVNIENHNYRSVEDLVGRTIHHSHSVLDVVYSVTHRSKFLDVSVNFFGVTPLLWGDPISFREFPPFGVALSIKGKFLANFDGLVETEYTVIGASKLAYVDFRVLTRYGFSPSWALMGGVMVQNIENVHLALGVDYNFGDFIAIAYGYRIALNNFFSDGYLGSHEVSLIYKVDWPQGVKDFGTQGVDFTAELWDGFINFLVPIFQKKKRDDISDKYYDF